jgi:flagellar basal body-associated protein FliL
MKLNDEKDVVKFIKDNVTPVEINLDVDKIIEEKHNATAANKAKRRSIFTFAPLTVLVTAAVVGLVVGSVFLFKPYTYDPFSSLTPQALPHGKAGEFVFLTTSVVNYADKETPIPLPRPLSAKPFTNDDESEITEVFDKTLPIIENFYQMSLPNSYTKIDGSFVGNDGETYTTKYEISENIYIITNISFTDEGEENNIESDTEIRGELFNNGRYYQLTGQQEIDPNDNEVDMSLLVKFDDTNYMELAAEHENRNQKFNFKLVENDVETFTMNLEGFKRGRQEHYVIDAEIAMNNKQYAYVLYEKEKVYYIKYLDNIIKAKRNEDGFVYNFPKN